MDEAAGVLTPLQLEADGLPLADHDAGDALETPVHEAGAALEAPDHEAGEALDAPLTPDHV